jgi:hypothetical protein
VRNKQEQNTVEEALRLLEALEQFGSFLSESNLSAREIAWGGYLQTITEIKRKLNKLQPGSEQEHNFDSSEKNEDDDIFSDKEILSASIAKRIRKMPPIRSGRVRELGSNASNGELSNEKGVAVTQQDVSDPNVER